MVATVANLARPVEYVFCSCGTLHGASAAEKTEIRQQVSFYFKIFVGGLPKTRRDFLVDEHHHHHHQIRL